MGEIADKRFAKSLPPAGGLYITMAERPICTPLPYVITLHTLPSDTSSYITYMSVLLYII